MLHPWGGASGTEQGTRETGSAIRTGVIVAAAIIFHQETKDVSADLMVEGEDTRRYLRTCGFTEAESEEIIADARAERVCCLLVLNLVSSTLSCIRRPRPRLLVLDVCGFV